MMDTLENVNGPSSKSQYSKVERWEQGQPAFKPFGCLTSVGPPCSFHSDTPQFNRVDKLPLLPQGGFGAGRDSRYDTLHLSLGVQRLHERTY